MSDDLLKLAERCEAATVTDLVALNADILRALGWRSVNGEAFAPGSPLRAIEVPYYVGSVDSAMTLVPEDREWVLANYRSPKTVARVGAFNQGSAATPALALCAAALRARARSAA